MKKYAWLIYLLGCFFLGALFTFLVYLGLWQRLISSFQSVSIWFYILLLPLAFYVTLTLHELGHLIAFRVQGIKIRALYLTIFVFFKDQKGWHVRVVPKLWVLFGGLVVPDLDEIHSDDDLKDVSNKFAKSLIAAPIVTISFMGITILAFLLTWMFSQGGLGFGLLTIFMIYTVLLSALYIYTFGLNTKQLYGDFVAYRKIKEDELFQFVELYQYQSFSLSHHEDQPYFYQKARHLIEKQSSIKINMFMIVTLMTYMEGVIHHKEPLSDKIDDMINHLSLHQLVKSEEGLTLIYTLIEYHYVKGDVEKAYQLLDRADKTVSKKIPLKLKLYLKKRCEHVIHHTYHETFLNNDENLYIGQAWLFEVLENPYDSLRKSHEPLPYQVYQCLIPENDEKA